MTIPKPKIKEYHFTYQTKNMLNEMTYIGVHSTTDLNDGYLGSGYALLNAINKYGKENFRSIPLCYFDTREEADIEEAYLVNESWVKLRGNYNIALGGGGGRIFTDTLPYIEAQKTRESGTIDGIFYPSIREACRKLGRSKDWVISRFRGTLMSPEELKKHQQKLYGNPINFRGVTYLSLRDAERQTGISRYLIRKEERPL